MQRPLLTVFRLLPLLGLGLLAPSCGGDASGEIPAELTGGGTEEGTPENEDPLAGIAGPADLVQATDDVIPEAPKNPLFYAVRNDLTEQVKQALEEEGLNPNEARLQDGLTPLHVAVGKGNDDIVALLLDHGADPSLTQGQGGTALHMAVDAGHVPIVRRLLKHEGVDVNARNRWGRTPLMDVLVSTQIVDEATRTEILNLLLDAGADVNVQSNDGSTALHAAAWTNRREAVEILLARGAATDKRQTSGAHPLHLAAQGGHLGIVELLLASGAEVNATTNEGVTPFQYAASKQHEETARYLQAQGGE